jgi:uncharacterized protein YceH (UPF0502 family)
VDVKLNEFEVRVLGALMEKKITTPDYYPLSLNALTNACNQKSSRDPVVAYDEQMVLHALDSLRAKNLAWVIKGSESRVLKYGHLAAEFFDLSPPQLAALCVLLLRGPQTAGEIRSRSGPLHNFDGLAEVEAALDDLTSRESGPLVVKLPRQPGLKESRYAHLLSGEIEITELEVAPRPASARAARKDDDRIAQLEAEVASLRQDIEGLQQQFLEFRKQFE